MMERTLTIEETEWRTNNTTSAPPPFGIFLLLSQHIYHTFIIDLLCQVSTIQAADPITNSQVPCRNIRQQAIKYSTALTC